MPWLWLNGAFGVGKTTTAREIVRCAPGRRVFDPEQVGFMLRANLSDQRFDDFQELPPWRALVPRVADVTECAPRDAVATILDAIEGHAHPAVRADGR